MTPRAHSWPGRGCRLPPAPWPCCAAAPRPRPCPRRTASSLAREWEGKILFLRSSLNVLPFFADGSKRLISPLHCRLHSRRFPPTPRAPPSPRGRWRRCLPMGTKVRIEKLEFPTGLVRNPPAAHTPRQNP